MKEVEVGKKRNIAVVGHHGSGKTSLIEAILYHTGATDRLGRIDDGNTTADYLDEEKAKKHTLTSKLLQCTYRDHLFNLIDTPGYSDFLGDIKGALRAADGVILVINAQNGVEVETEKIWEYIEEYNLPRCVVVNRMDKERADFGAALKSLEDVLEAQVCPVRLPVGKEDSFKGVVNLITDKFETFDDKGNIVKQEPIPEDMSDEEEEYRQKMIEAAVYADEELMERYLSDEKISNDEIRKGLADGALQGAIVPIFATEATKCIGIQTLLDGLINYMPNPLASKKFQVVKKGDDKPQDQDIKEDGNGIGLVFKSMIDPFAGKVSFIRVFSGEFHSETDWYNITTDKKSRVGHILAVNGKKHTSTNRASAGDIVAVTKMDDFDTNSTLSSKDGKLLVEPTKYPQPPIHMAVHAADKNEEDKIGSALPKIVAGDPTLKIERSQETNETVISAAGSMQTELIAYRLRNQFKLNVELTTPQIAYRETITAEGEGRYRHKKQSGGRGQFGEVQMRVKPLERGKQYEFVNKIFGGSVPTKFIPAVEKGVVEAIAGGVLAGYPVVDVCCELFDGQYHDVDSSEMAFKTAGRQCFRQVARDNCKAVLLEPIMDVRVTIPEAYMGDVMGDLNSRRGRVQGMDAEGKKQIIKAQVPLSEMYTYSIDLRSITQGRGSFEMDFTSYEQVPRELADKIISGKKTDNEEED
jgi:elongation factor G